MMLQWHVRLDAVLAIQIRGRESSRHMADAGDVAQRVVLVNTPAAIQVLLGQKAAQPTPLEAVAFVVFIAQVLQAATGVIAEIDAVAEGITRLINRPLGS